MGGAAAKVMSPGKGQCFAFVTATQFKPSNRLAEELGRRLREIRYQPKPQATTIIMSQKPQTVLEYAKEIFNQNTLIMEMFEELQLSAGSQDQVRDLESRLNEAEEEIKDLKDKLALTSALLEAAERGYKCEIADDFMDFLHRHRSSTAPDAPVDEADDTDDDDEL